MGDIGKAAFERTHQFGADGVAIVPIRSRHDGAYVRYVKPVMDVVGGIVLSILTLPIVAAVVVAIWATMGPGALYVQPRVGKNGRIFDVYKFRTMEADRRASDGSFVGADRRVNHKDPNDPRMTPLGRFLRKWSIDEIPQFWNVAKGDMSLVGPRPELVSIVQEYEPWQHARHRVKPGVTGLWQVSERGDTPLHEATEVDLAYLDNVSLMTDLKVLALTVPAALGRRTGH